MSTIESHGRRQLERRSLIRELLWLRTCLICGTAGEWHCDTRSDIDPVSLLNKTLSTTSNWKILTTNHTGGSNHAKPTFLKRARLVPLSVPSHRSYDGCVVSRHLSVTEVRIVLLDRLVGQSLSNPEKKHLGIRSNWHKGGGGWGGDWYKEGWGGDWCTMWCVWGSLSDLFWGSLSNPPMSPVQLLFAWTSYMDRPDPPSARECPQKQQLRILKWNHISGSDM